MTTVSEMQAAIDKSLVNMDRLDRVVNGDTTTTVSTDGGTVKSVAKLQADLIAEVEAGLAGASVDSIVGLQSALNTKTSLLDLVSTAAGKGASLVGVIGSYWTTVQGFIDYLLSSAGSAIVGYIGLGTGATNRSVQSKLREVVSVKDFGAVGNGVADDTAAFKAARDYFATSSDYRGGKIYVPKGRYVLTDELAFTPYGAGQVYNITIEGDGPLASHIDFSGAGTGKNGLSFVGQGAHISVSNLSITGAPAKGLVVSGGSIGTDSYILYCSMDNVRVQGCGAGGVYIENIFMTRLNHVWSKNNTGAGFQFVGFHTSITANTCWASDNTDSGWRINGAIYSSFNACGSDRNLYGYRLTNVSGTMTSCGAEDSIRDSFLVETSTALSSGVPSASQNINLTMVGCYGIRGSTVGANAYANFLAALTANSRPINVTLVGCISRQDTSTAKALVVNAASGTIDIWGATTMGNSFDSSNVNTGGTIH